MTPLWMRIAAAVEVGASVYLLVLYPVLMLYFVIIPLAAGFAITHIVELKRTAICNRLKFHGKEADTVALFLGFVAEVIAFDYAIIFQTNMGDFWGTTLLIMFGFLMTAGYLLKLYLYTEPPLPLSLFTSYGAFVLLSLGPLYILSILQAVP